MAVPNIESRIAALEAEVALLTQRLRAPGDSTGDWLDETFGVFAADPIHEEAMRLGREYRKNLRPKPTTKRGRKKSRKKSLTA